MSEPTQLVRLDGRRLVLGFDGGCMTCSSLAKRIEEQVGGKLEVLSLRDHRVEQWRRTALGEDAPWAPTLVEVKGLRVRAWTGWQMAVQIGRFLGPVATWRVMQALGEVEAAPKIEHSSVVEKLPGRAAEAVVGMSRGQFLKGVGGAAVAMGALSGFGPFAPQAQALEQWQYPDSVSFKRLTGGTLRDYCNRIAKRQSTEWTAGSTYAPAMQSGLSVSGADDEVASGNNVHARAGIHTMASGKELYVCTFTLKDEKLLTYYEWEGGRYNDQKYEAKRWGIGPSKERVWLERAVINGSKFTDPAAPSLQADCPTDCASYTSGQRQATCCSSLDIACALDQAATGVVGCAAARPACATAFLPGEILVCLATAYLCVRALYTNCCRVTCTFCVDCYVPYT